MVQCREHSFDPLSGNEDPTCHAVQQKNKKKKIGREQDGGGVGGHRVHLSPGIHQEYTFRHRSACRTPAESRQEYLTSGKEYIETHKNSRSSLESLKWEH